MHHGALCGQHAECLPSAAKSHVAPVAPVAKSYVAPVCPKVCAPLLRVLGALASPMACLGVPHVDVRHRHPATLGGGAATLGGGAAILGSGAATIGSGTAAPHGGGHSVWPRLQSRVCLCARQARGESDGGGPHGEACSELAAELAALGARLLGLLEEQVA